MLGEPSKTPPQAGGPVTGDEAPARARDSVIVALDCGLQRAQELAPALVGHVGWAKVGMELFYSAGPEAVARMKELGLKVFLDLKLHDIPNTVACAARVLAGLGADMVTVHAGGGPAMVAAAKDALVQGAAAAGVEPPRLLAVTVLTSMDQAQAQAVGMGRPVAEQARSLALMACESGADGVVCSPQESAAMRSCLPAGSLIVTPGVRPAGADLGDQSRVATPAQAILAGSTHLVVGRPITRADDPVAAADAIVSQVAQAMDAQRG